MNPEPSFWTLHWASASKTIEEYQYAPRRSETNLHCKSLSVVPQILATNNTGSRGPFGIRSGSFRGRFSSNMYSYRAPDVFHSFFKPLLGELRKKIEVTSMESNLFFLISPSYCGTICLLTGARHGRKNSTKYLINQSLRNNIQIRLIKQWSITPILFSTTWHQLSSCFVPVAIHTVTIFVT